jgi:argininosuccinate lyase
LREGALGPPTEGPAPELIEAGFAVEVAHAPFLHDGLNLADIAHVLTVLEGRVIPADAAGRLLKLLLEVSRMPAASFPYEAGSTQAGRAARPAGWRCAWGCAGSSPGS